MSIKDIEPKNKGTDRVAFNVPQDENPAITDETQ
jgi:hypothetical protein